jgi:hypothetical protein
VRAEIGFIDLDLAVLEGRLARAFFGDAVTDFAKDRDDRAMRDVGQLGRISGV